MHSPNNDSTSETLPRIRAVHPDKYMANIAPRQQKFGKQDDPDEDCDLDDGDAMSRWDAYLATKPGRPEALTALAECK